VEVRSGVEMGGITYAMSSWLFCCSSLGPLEWHRVSNVHISCSRELFCVPRSLQLCRRHS
jgi:hypothetical protein